MNLMKKTRANHVIVVAGDVSRDRRRARRSHNNARPAADAACRGGPTAWRRFARTSRKRSPARCSPAYSMDRRRSGRPPRRGQATCRPRDGKANPRRSAGAGQCHAFPVGAGRCRRMASRPDDHAGCTLAWCPSGTTRVGLPRLGTQHRWISISNTAAMPICILDGLLVIERDAPSIWWMLDAYSPYFSQDHSVQAAPRGPPLHS